MLNRFIVASKSFLASDVVYAISPPSRVSVRRSGAEKEMTATSGSLLVHSAQ
jgi:hypothetical protein